MIHNKKGKSALIGLFLAALPLTTVQASYEPVVNPVEDSVDTASSDIATDNQSNSEDNVLVENSTTPESNSTIENDIDAEDDLPTEEDLPTVNESYTKLDDLVLELRQTYGNDWDKIDAILLSEDIKVVDEVSSEPEELIEVLPQNLVDSNVTTKMRVYKDMNSSYYHVRGYWDWNDHHYDNHYVYPSDAAGIGVSSSLVGYVRNNSYVKNVYAENWTSYAGRAIIEEASGNGKMAIRFKDQNTIDGYVGAHGVFGYSLDNPKKTLSFEAGFVHSWSGGKLESVSAAFPFGVSVSYSSAANYQRESSTSLTIKASEWSSITTTGKQVKN